MCNVPVIIWCKLILRLLNDLKKKERERNSVETPQFFDITAAIVYPAQVV